MDKTQGLICPECSGVVPITEGARFVTCPFCQINLLLQGENGVRRWQVTRQVERAQVEQAVRGFFSGAKKASDLKRSAEIKEIFLIYAPYWRVQSDVAGWIFGKERKDKDTVKPIEVEVLENMHWSDAALEVSEYGVQRMTVAKNMLQPYDSAALHAEALVFEPTESATDALAEAHQYFIDMARSKKKLETYHFEKFHFFHEALSLVYYPLWVARYSYRQRQYQVVVDGVNGRVLYGKAPGNIMYRAASLVAGMAAGNFILVNGTLIAGRVLLEVSSDDDTGLLVLLPIAMGLGLIIAGYRSFRYGEEVEQIDGQVKKAIAGKKHGGTLLGSLMNTDSVNFDSVLKSGLSLIDEMSATNKNR
jgi:hypothetical protein